MAFLQTLVIDAEQIIGPVLHTLAQTPTVQAIEKYAFQVILAVEFKQTSFRVGEYTVSATWNNAPAPLTLAAAFLAIENVAAGQTGTFQSGSITISIEKTPVAVAGTV